MKKIAYILTKHVSHQLFFSQFLKDEYECYELSPDEINLSEFKHFIMDLIIIDSNAISSSLYSALRTLRNCQDLSNTPIFVISNQLKKNYRKKLKRSGATAILTEPLNKAEVKEAISKGKAFHQVVEKTSHVHVMDQTNIQSQSLSHQSVIDVATLENIDESFHEKKPYTLVMAKLILMGNKALSNEDILQAQKTIGQILNTKTLIFLSSTELFFTTNQDLKMTKSICQRIKNHLTSKEIGICFGIATNLDEKKTDTIQDYLRLARDRLIEAMKQPNSIVGT